MWTNFALLPTASNLTCWGRDWIQYQNQFPVKFTSITSGGNAVMYGILNNQQPSIVTASGANQSFFEPDQIQKIMADDRVACVLTTGGLVRCYDSEYRVQQYTGWTNTLSNVVDIDMSLGFYNNEGHMCTVLSSGNLDCYVPSTGQSFGNGNNESGEANDRTGVNAVKVATGEDHTCIINTSGAVQCWGSYSGSPPAVTDAVEIEVTQASWMNSTCIRRSSGVVNCWGNAPSAVANPLNNATSIAMTRTQTGCATTATGSVQCWGRVGDEEGDDSWE